MVEQATVGAKAPARVKDLLVNELVENWSQMQTFVVACPIGLDAVESNNLRSDLTEKNVKMTVVKNSIARLAFEKLNLAPAAELLDQASAVCYGGESVVDVARALVDWSKKLNALQLRGAFVEGKLFSPDEVAKLAAMPNRTELLGQIIALIGSPGARIASALTAPGARLAGAVVDLTQKLQEQTTAAETAQTKEDAQPQEPGTPKNVPESKEPAEPSETDE